DGLVCQRYLRKTQQGTGTDLLANNCSPVVGLYRNIYGVQPKWNRLFLEPHLTPELHGTQLRYWLRGQTYVIDLSEKDYRIAASGLALRDREPFGANLGRTALEYFHSTNSIASLKLVRPADVRMEVQIETWSGLPRGARAWTLTCGAPGSTVKAT